MHGAGSYDLFVMWMEFESELTETNGCYLRVLILLEAASVRHDPSLSIKFVFRWALNKVK